MKFYLVKWGKGQKPSGVISIGDSHCHKIGVTTGQHLKGLKIIGRAHRLFAGAVRAYKVLKLKEEK